MLKPVSGHIAFQQAHVLGHVCVFFFQVFFVRAVVCVRAGLGFRWVRHNIIRISVRNNKNIIRISI